MDSSQSLNSIWIMKAINAFDKILTCISNYKRDYEYIKSESLQFIKEHKDYMNYDSDKFVNIYNLREIGSKSFNDRKNILKFINIFTNQNIPEDFPENINLTINNLSILHTKLFWHYLVQYANDKQLNIITNQNTIIYSPSNESDPKNIRDALIHHLILDKMSYKLYYNLHIPNI